MVHLKAPLHSYWWRGINRFMRHGGPLYKPGNTHQKEVPPSATYSIFCSITVHVNTWANSECVLVNSSWGFDAFTIVKHSISFCNDKIWRIHIVLFPTRPTLKEITLKDIFNDQKIDRYFWKFHWSRKVILCKKKNECPKSAHSWNPQSFKQMMLNQYNFSDQRLVSDNIWSTSCCRVILLKYFYLTETLRGERRMMMSNKGQTKRPQPGRRKVSGSNH